MVQSKADRERQKLITDKCQSLVEALLKEDDNKYCVDCDSKGPRWASWNLGIFLCIRCAGIHRNLGVHISKVKSVNLDTWTPEHVAYMQRMGNNRARTIYEANLPDDFRRPQTDTALESFIRAKYEHKKYIVADYVEPGPPAPAFNIDEELKRMKELKRSKVTGGAGGGAPRIISLNEPSSLMNSKPRPTDALGLKNKMKATTPGLVDLETVAATEAAVKSSGSSIVNLGSNKTTNENNSNLLVGFDFDSPITTIPTHPADKTSNNSGLEGLLDSTPTIPASKNDIDLDFSTPSSSQQSTAGGGGSNSAAKALTKESILSLYSFSPSTTNAGTTDHFGLNTSSDIFRPNPVAAPSFNNNNISNLSLLTDASSNNTSGVRSQNASLMSNFSNSSGLTTLLGSNNNFTVSPGSDQLLMPFANSPVGQTHNFGLNSQKNQKKNLDEMFAGLDILHPKPR